MAKTNINEDYELGKELGRGSFSVVHLGKNKKTGEQCAVKVIRKSDVSDEKSLKRINTEVEILKKVQHPNIIGLKDLYDDGKTFYMVMQLVTGGELFDKIVKKGQYSEQDACSVIKKVVSAIHYLHSHGIAHRDLKPENLLVQAEDDTHVMISDFGLSRIMGESSFMSTACGTPYYVAPEVIAAKPYGKEVDMWSIGVITYFLLCGYPPFMGETLPEIFEGIQSAAYEFTSPDWDKVSKDAKDFITRLLVVDSGKRMTAEESMGHNWLKTGGAGESSKLNISAKLSERKTSLKFLSKKQ